MKIMTDSEILDWNLPTVCCNWFTVKGKFRSANFPIAALTLAVALE